MRCMNRSSCPRKINIPSPLPIIYLRAQSICKIAASVIALALLGFIGTSCGTPANSTTFASQAQPPPHVILGPGDVIKLSFPAAPELNQAQKIRADGRLSLPLVGEVDAAHKTVGQLQSELVQLYKPQLKSPEVVVTLEGSTTTVVVSGSVAKPGKIVFDRPTTVFQAIMEAGGATAYGNLRGVRLIRTINGVQKSQVLNLRGALNGESTNAFYVRDGDVIYVPQSAF